MKKALNKLLSMIIIISLAGSLSGCTGVSDFIKQDVASALTNRINENISIATKLKENGLLSQGEYDNIVNHLTTLHDNYKVNEDGEVSDGGDETFLNALVGWWTPPPDKAKAKKLGFCPVNEDGTNTCDEMTEAEFEDYWNSIILTNSLMNNTQAQMAVPLFNGTGTVEPLILVDKELGASINDKFGYEIYVLDSSKFSNLVGGQPLDEVFSATDFVETENKFPEAFKKYFKPATEVKEDGTEKTITLLDTSLKENQLVKVTSGVDECVSSTGERKVCNIKNSKNFEPGYKNEPGKDMVLNQGEGYPNIMAIRLQEFNKKAADKIIETLGSSPDKYIFDASEKRAYLMEYPVHYVNEIEQSKENTSTYEMGFTESNIGVNLKTGKIIKYDRAYGISDGLHGVEIATNDNYLTIGGAESEDEMNSLGGRSSFVIYGDTDDEDDLVVIDNKDESKQKKAKTARIVLRDYLELTYMPEIVKSENIVALGRKLRIQNFRGSNNTIVAKFYDKAGIELEDSAELFIYDFLDSEKLLKEDKVYFIDLDRTPNKEETEEQENGEAQNSGGEADGEHRENITGESEENKKGTESNQQNKKNSTEDTEDNKEVEKETEEDRTDGGGSSAINSMQASAAKIDRLKKIPTSSINPSLQFPGPYIAKVDTDPYNGGKKEESEDTEDSSDNENNTEEEKLSTEEVDDGNKNITNRLPLFYGMALKSNMFDTALFSNWINNGDESANSVHWWLKWLKDTGFKYTFNINELEGFLNTNYKLELGENEIIVLDLNVIAKLQEDLTERGKIKQNSLIRTAFIVLGYALVGFSLLLMLAWACDVNLDLGVQVLEKVTFGSWIAIKDEDDLKLNPPQGKRYVSLWGMITSCLTIAIIGILLIVIDIMSVVGMLIGMIQGIITWIQGLLL